MSQHRQGSHRALYRRHLWSPSRTVFVSITVGLVVMASLGFSNPAREAPEAAAIEESPQTFTITAADPPLLVERHDFGATAGYETYIAGGTNHDWAKLVLLKAGFPLTDSNVTVVTRWMRQENYVDAWWTRNNPLNNGWGSGGGGGTGRYSTLVDAADNAAEALHALPRYSEIVRTLSASAPTDEVERAIWFSGWASGMYNNGQHWSYVAVPVITAPPSAWGR